MNSNIIFFLYVVGALITGSAAAQRRFIEKPEGITAGFGGTVGRGPGSVSSSGFTSAFSFRDGIEFIFSAGSVTGDGETAGFLSPGIEIYGSAGSLRPFVDFEYTKTDHVLWPKTVSIFAGTSFDILHYGAILFAPEISYGMALPVGKNIGDDPSRQILAIGLSTGYRFKKTTLVYFSASAARSRHKWSRALGLGFLFG